MGRLAHEAKSLIGKNWSKSSQTREKLLGNIERIAAHMETQGLQSIEHLKTKHVQGFFKSLEERGLSASTRAGYATAMREIAGAIGKQNIVPRTNDELGISRADRYDPKQGDMERLQQIQERLQARGEWQGLAFEMQRAFGLRLKESLLSNKVILSDGTARLVIEGAKGGRPRTLPIDTQERRDLVDRVQNYIRENGQRSLIPAAKTLEQGYNRQKNDLYRMGATKENRANSHLYRHAYAQNMGREGRPDKEIAEALGHGREEVVRHYK